MTLEEHIDEPIKKCVVGLALLGYDPIFSCCGFSYKGEKIKKDHLDEPYIYLDLSSMNQLQKSFILDLSKNAGWHITFAGPDILNLKGSCFGPYHPWSKKDSPHRYEQNVISIKALENFIESQIDKFNNQSTIKDGNKTYKNKYGLKHWQYEESDDWTVTPDIFNQL